MGNENEKWENEKTALIEHIHLLKRRMLSRTQDNVPNNVPQCGPLDPKSNTITLRTLCLTISLGEYSIYYN